MAEPTQQFLTSEKKDELIQELHLLKQETIPGLARRIDEARSLGDLSENAEYHQAREDLAWAQSRMKEIGYILEQSVLIQHTKGNDIVRVGSTVTAEIRGAVKIYMVVGPQEADPAHGRISNESPLGQAFLGKRAGDVVEVETPAGIARYAIQTIS